MEFKIDPEFKLANRQLTQRERDGLYKAIAEDGVRDGSLVCGQIDGDPSLYLIDGHNTLDICREQGIRPPSPTVKMFKSREDVLTWMHERPRGRRNLSPDEMAAQRQKRISRVAEAHKEGKSTRAIAEQEGVSQSQVQRDLEEAKATEPPGSVAPDTGKIKGADGKERPATTAQCARCKRVGQITGCQKCAELIAKRESRKAKKQKRKPTETAVKGDADEGELEKFTDAEGLSVPADAVPAFQAAKDIEAVCRELNAIIKRVEAISKGPGGRLIRFPSFKQQVDDAKGNIWANRATHVCPYCKGAGKVKGKECEACKGECWVAKHIHAAAPGVTKHK